MKHLSFAIGLVVFSIGLSAFMGYLLEFAKLYAWNGGSGMAINTSIALTLTGMAIAILSSRRANGNPVRPPIQDEPTTII